MLDRVRISNQGRQQLIQLRRKTGIQQNNTLLRMALVLSLLEKSQPPKENLGYQDGLELDWKVFCSGETALYSNLLIMRCLENGGKPTAENIRELLQLHVHRGLSYLNTKPQNALLDQVVF